MADAVSLRCSIDRAQNAGRSSSRRQGRARVSPRRSHKRSTRNHRGQVRKNSKSRVSVDLGRRDQRRRNKDRGARNKRRENKQAPELWAACERNDPEGVAQLLAEGKDTEVVFAGWTPLMKAAEDNAVECLQQLLLKKANIEACTRKGRTALSLAAAPVARNKPAATAVLRALLEHGADDTRVDEMGKTAKDRAVMAKRHGAIAIFEAWGLCQYGCGMNVLS